MLSKNVKKKKKIKYSKNNFIFKYKKLNISTYLSSVFMNF